MTPEDFSSGIMRYVVEDGVVLYRKMYSETAPERGYSAEDKRALTLFHNLSPDQQSVFFEIIRQVSVDTVSSVLAVIDGVSFIGDAREEYTLLYDGQELNGDLQHLFLAEEELREKAR